MVQVERVLGLYERVQEVEAQSVLDFARLKVVLGGNFAHLDDALLSFARVEEILAHDCRVGGYLGLNDLQETLQNVNHDILC